MLQLTNCQVSDQLWRPQYKSQDENIQINITMRNKYRQFCIYAGIFVGFGKFKVLILMIKVCMVCTVVL